MMYIFGIAVLLGLGVYAVAMMFDRFLSIALEFWAVVLAGLGIAAAWLADFNAWELWGVPVREDWIGVTLTGLMVGGIAVAFRAVGRLVAALSRKVADEAETLEKEQSLRRVA